MRFINEVISGSYSLIAGLGITIKAFFSPIATVQYPREVIDITPSYRGHIEFVHDLVTGKPKCISCGTCAMACPSNCITVEGKPLEIKREPFHATGWPPAISIPSEKKKAPGYVERLERPLILFELDFAKCSLCGLCIEVCPENAIQFSKVYNLAGYCRQDSRIDLKNRFEEIS